MISLGIFNKSGKEFHGVLETLSILREVMMIPSGLEGDGNPQYALHYADRPAAIGFGWKCRRDDGEDYIRVVIDDPGFPAPINCRLVKSECGYDLLWDERRPGADDRVMSAMLDALYDAEMEIQDMLQDYSNKASEDISAHRTLKALRSAIEGAEATAAPFSGCQL